MLLPGLGADERLFEGQRQAFPELLVPAWPRWRADDSLASFAARLVDAMPAADSDRIVPGGGHLLTLTHPEAVNAFLRDVVDGRTEGRTPHASAVPPRPRPS